MNPIEKFTDWHQAELRQTTLQNPSSCCLSTVGTDGFPNSRFVSLKEIKTERFVVTGSYASRKAREIAIDNKVALAFWWPCTERQVRIQGVARVIGRAEADRYFHERGRSAQLVSSISRQGQACTDYEALTDAYHQLETRFEDTAIPCPDDWGGFQIDPIRIEFLAFKPTRLHERTLYQRIGSKWEPSLLQP